MLTLDRPQDTASKERNVAHGECVRVRANGAVLELPLGKTTIGSSPRCNLRIQQPGVQPLHCLILRDADGLSVRRWAGETVLNGQRLEESAIGVGDCLKVGPVELEIVRPQAPAATSSSAGSVPPVPSRLSCVEPTSTVQPGTAKSNSFGRDLSRARSRKLLAALRSERMITDERQARIAELQRQLERAAGDRQDLAGQLQGMVSDLAASRQQTTELEASFQINQNLASENELLNGEICSLKQRIEQLADDHSSAAASDQVVSAERETLVVEQQRLSDENGQLNEQLQRLEKHVAELTAECEQTRGQCNSLSVENHELNERQNSLSQQYGQLEEQCDGLRSLESQLENQLAELRDERDELQQHNEQLRTELTTLTEEQASLVKGEAGKDQECESLREQLQASHEELAARTSERDALVAERNQLREESGKLPHLEQKIRDVVADRENTSSELYRALLQLAAMQERDDQHKALAEANAAINAELAKSTQDVAALQAQLDRLHEERKVAQDMRQALDQQAAELIDAHQQLAYDKTALHAELAELKEQLAAVHDQAADRSENLASVNELREQLEASESSYATLCKSLEELQSELSSKTQSEAKALAAAAEHERQIADHAKQLAKSQQSIAELESRICEGPSVDLEESVEQLKSELTKCEELLEKSQTTLADRDRQIAEYTQLLSESSEAVQSLEKQLTNADQSAEIDQLRMELEQQQYAAAQVRSEFEEQIAGLESKLASAETAAFEATHARTEELTSVSQSMYGSQSEDSEPLAERALKSLEEKLGWSHASEKSAGSDSNWSVASSYGDASPAHSLEKDEAGEQQDSTVAETSVESEPQPEHKQPESYIDRYSHLFAEEAEEAQPHPVASVARTPEPQYNELNSSNNHASRSNGSSPFVAHNDDEEESIEDYMAKLLQRVRGESPAAKVQSEAAASATDKKEPQANGSEAYSSVPLTAPPSMTNGDPTLPMGFAPRKPRSAMPAPQTDLEALRALANESARRAISRHAQRKHRRVTMTKVIVSTLAAVTSVWLMLNAEKALSLEFIAGCMTMMVAAYWACEALRAFVQALRASKKDEVEREIEELSAELRAPLPIDVESTRQWTSHTPLKETIAEQPVGE